ncbi:MAG TPA: hypothetical protein VLH40_00005, partial [Atribacteraceae bacterium]|nr:hypothetical protein [Atribacteraceae bacterium]
MASIEGQPRHQAYDETIKNLQVKDCRGLASIVLPDIFEAEDVILNLHELSMADMKKPDYLAKIKLHGEHFLLHLEFEANYRSNKEMQRRMLRYYSSLYWNEDLPILQAVIILKEPAVKVVSQGFASAVLGQDVLKHHYRIVKLYDMDKYEILKKQITALYPLRVFMQHRNEPPVDHIRECLEVAETTDDPDFYFLTVECGRKLFGIELLEKIVKEAIYMASTLYKHPYEAGRIEGRIEGKTELVIKQLSKK